MKKLYGVIERSQERSIKRSMKIKKQSPKQYKYSLIRREHKQKCAFVYNCINTKKMFENT